MRSLIWIIVVASAFFMVPPAGSQKTPQNLQLTLQLPDLHKVQLISLSPSYSCRSKEEVRKGFGNTALFLSGHSKKRNSPELLFNGACNSPDYFDVQTAGDNLDVITDYGDVRLADMTAQHVFSPQRRTDSLSNFAKSVKVQTGHTYGVLINKGDTRGFFYFRVARYVPNQKVDLEFVVMHYQVLRLAAESPGFAWDAKSSY